MKLKERRTRSSMQSEDIIKRLEANFPEAQITAKDLTGTGDHWQVTVISEKFTGKSMVEQHQLVYQALGEWLKKEIHALSLKTNIPEKK